MKKYKSKIIAGVVLAVALIFAFWYGGAAPGLRGWTPYALDDTDATTTAVNMEEAVTDDSGVIDEEMASPGPVANDDKSERVQDSEALDSIDGDVEYSENKGMVIDADTGKDRYQTDPVPEGKPLPVEPQDAVVTESALTCTLSVRCDTILNNMDMLEPDKVDIVPQDGVIFPRSTVVFYEGESVFDLLHREMKENKIHLEFEDTPIYNSAYIEGIGNLYEFDCGELSGWMYKVNGWFPNYGCSRYQLKAGDVVEWVYTCDLGVDVGGHYSAKGEG